MWISKQIIKEQKVPAVECGKVTMSSNVLLRQLQQALKEMLIFTLPTATIFVYLRVKGFCFSRRRRAGLHRS